MTWTLITGGSLRLGRAIARKLAENHHAVVIQYHRSEQEATALAEELRLLNIPAEILFGDFSTIEGVEFFIQNYQNRFESTQALVNNVGPWLKSPLLSMPVTLGHTLFQTNFFAPFRLMQALSKSLILSRGAIVNIGITGANSIHAHTDALFYFSAKQALFEATKAFAKELSSYHVRVNMISPGYMTHSVELPKKPIPLSFTEETEIANLALFLLSSHNQTLTGKNIEVDGGITL